MKKLVLFLVALVIILIPATSFGQVKKEEVKKEEVKKEEVKKEEVKKEEVTTVDDLSNQIAKISHDWKTVGWQAGLAALIGLLILLLRFKPLDNFLQHKGWKKYKPYIAMVLGALAAFFSTWATGSLWPDSVVAAIMGLFAGLSSVGLHQAFTVGNEK